MRAGHKTSRKTKANHKKIIAGENNGGGSLENQTITGILSADKTALILLFLVCLAFLFAIPFQGEFGLNDDPDYARAVKEFAFEGKYYPENYSSIMLTQIAYGALFVKAFGFSHAILRVSVMLLSIVGVLLFFVLARLFGFSQKHAMLVSLVLLVNPFFVVLGHSFMSDVPFTVLILAALVPLAAWAKKNDARHLAIGCSALVLAFFLKQWALLFFAGIAAFVFFCRTSKKEKAIIAATALVFAVALAWSLPHYALDDKGTYFKPVSGKYALPLLFGVPFYVAFFLFPFSLAMLANKSVFREILGKKKKLFFSTIFACIGITVGLVVFKRFLPFFSNVLNPFGLGPKMLVGEAAGIIPEWFWMAATVFSAISLVFILQSISFRLEKKKEALLVALMAGIYVLQMMANWYFIDRYLLPIVPILLLLVLEPLKEKKFFSIGLFATIVFFGAFGFVFTAEYLSWNQTSWKLINELRTQGVPEDKIDGGMDYCRSTFGQNETRLLRSDTNYYTGICGKGCREKGYAIAFKPVDGCTVVKSEPYFVFGAKFGEIFVLEK